MGTRSTIWIKKDNGNYDGVYCHWDGYLENNGKILAEYYTNELFVNDLLQHGDISSLGIYVYPTGEHSFKNRQENVCVFYHRDRGEDLYIYESKHFPEGYFEEYNYIFNYNDDQQWYVEYDGEIKLLSEALKGI